MQEPQIRNRLKSRLRAFTMLELVVVIAIMAVVGTVVMMAVGRRPTFVVIDDATNNIEAVLLQGSMQSLAQGKEISVTYSPDEKTISLQTLSEDSEQYAAGESLPSKYFSYKVPEDIQIEFTGGDGEIPSFLFFPDGTASGPELTVSYMGHTFAIGVSPLTGMVIKNYISD